MAKNPTLQAIGSAVGKFRLHFQCELYTQGNAKCVFERCKMYYLELELWDSQGCMMFMHKNTTLRVVEITVWHGATAWCPLPKSQLAVGVMARLSVTLCWRPVFDCNPSSFFIYARYCPVYTFKSTLYLHTESSLRNIACAINLWSKLAQFLRAHNGLLGTRSEHGWHRKSRQKECGDL